MHNVNYKQGCVLSTAEARNIAASGGVAWCVLVEFGNPDKSYNGPVTFSPANVGYYVEELGNVNDELEDVASDMLSAVLDDDKNVKVRFTLTDFDPDDFGPIVFADFGDGTFALYQAIEK